MELRFVNRDIAAPELGENMGRTVKILQWRDRNGGVRKWTDVPLVDEKDDER